jgi:hypothetical protein
MIKRGVTGFIYRAPERRPDAGCRKNTRTGIAFDDKGGFAIAEEMGIQKEFLAGTVTKKVRGLSGPRTFFALAISEKFAA